MTRTTPELANTSPTFRTTPALPLSPVSKSCTPLARPAQRGCYAAPAVGRLVITRRIVSGKGFRNWNTPAPKPIPYHKATAATWRDENNVYYIFTLNTDEEPIIERRRMAKERKARWLARQSQESLDRIRAVDAAAY
ncbi:hypothetical protein AVEN_15421-1 [Araneus ventricosus]|uniref:Uncharacterized protein n=1 Tax=Araneus ventricosus TaxID=182803 RepID=A0A4Y2CTH5_ARAVE|nr:hypothetical protein AVEN_15421-1 [Araneus ventricosus]